MKIEEELFKGYQVEESKLIPFGFVLKDKVYSKISTIMNGDFSLVISIASGVVDSKIYDINFGDEYTLFRSDKNVGEFVGMIREQLTEELLKVRDNCFFRVQFSDSQSIRIADYIFKTYGDKPDFPWYDYPYYGVFRNKENNRWYGLIMDVKENKLGEGVSARSVINIKPNPSMFNELLKLDNIFPGWHMNKKSWISVLLSNYFPDEYVESLIDMSYSEVNGLSKVKIFPPKKK